MLWKKIGSNGRNCGKGSATAGDIVEKDPQCQAVLLKTTGMTGEAVENLMEDGIWERMRSRLGI